jgi:hypothetical protein
VARTVKQEWSGPDGWHVGRRLERKARPAGRILDILDAEMAADDVQSIEDYLALEALEEAWRRDDELADAWWDEKQAGL